MKIKIDYRNVIGLDEVEVWIEGQIISLSALRRIEEAEVTLTWNMTKHPCYEASIRLTSQGREYHSTSHAYALTTAFSRSLQELENMFIADAINDERDNSSGNFSPSRDPVLLM